MATWEYKIELVTTQGTEATKTLKSLNDLGKQGWEAVTWLPNRGQEGGWVLRKKHHG